MTPHTEAERAEFEAWLGITPCGAAHDLAWSAWNRRAPAAPVQMPQPVAMLSVGKSGIAMHLHTAHPLDRFDSGNHDLLLASEVRAMLAASPQPPEAAPVPQALTDAQITIACLSYRHDFGLMHASERKALIFQAREWERALNKARGAA